MSVTPQTNATLEEIAQVLLKAKDICICGHTNPDGDAIGSATALGCALKKLDKSVSLLLADDDSDLDPKFDFLPGADGYVHAKGLDRTFEVFVCVDVPNADRLGTSAAAIHERSKTTVTIDHHANPFRASDLSYTDPDAASTTLIIWQLIKCLGIDADADIATCTLSGLMTDTGSFQYQNSDPLAFMAAAEMVKAGASPNDISNNLFQRKSLAAVELEGVTIKNMQMLCDGKIALSYITLADMERTQATKSDCDTLINVLRSIEGVDVACILKEQPDCIRGSFRAKGDTDVAAIAREFEGGGHRAAAGFTMHEDLVPALAIITKRLSSIFESGCAR